MNESYVVAVSERRIMVYYLSSEELQSTEGEKEIQDLYKGEGLFYILYDDCVTLLNPRDLEEQLLFSKENLGEIQRICQVRDSYLYEVGGRTYLWPESEEKSSKCCAVM